MIVLGGVGVLSGFVVGGLWLDICVLFGYMLVYKGI